MRRFRRLRANPAMRRMVCETRLNAADFIYPIFVAEGNNIMKPVDSMPTVYQYSIDNLEQILPQIADSGISGLLIFGIPEKKDELATEAYNDKGVTQQAIRYIKEHYPDLLIIADVCLCEYTSHGHCGVVKGDKILNDSTLPLLCKMAVSLAKAGADIIAPSDMMDGRVAAIRAVLDEHGYETTPIMAYSAKYASAFYGPFRAAAGSAPSFGDRKGYQMDPHNRKEALKECALDEAEGADILMVKPALSYLDVIRECSDAFDLPMCAYSVSGEYAMIKAAGAAGLVDEYRIMCESALSVFRAGANMLITYYAKELAQAIQKGDIG